MPESAKASHVRNSGSTPENDSTCHASSEIFKSAAYQHKAVLIWFCCILFLFFGYKIYLLSTTQFILPKASDPLQYSGPSVFGNMVYTIPSFPRISMPMTGWPWFDRITLAIGLRLAYLGSEIGLWANYASGTIYSAALDFVTLAAGTLWLAFNANPYGALLFCVFYIFSPLIAPYITTVSPESGLAAFSILAYVMLYFRPASQKSFPLLSGVFAALSAFSKAPGIFVPPTLLLLMYFDRRDSRSYIRFLLGIVIGTSLTFGLFTALYGYEQFIRTVETFFIYGLETNFYGRPNYNNFVSYIEVIAQQEHLPGILGLLLCAHASRHTPYRRLFFYSLSFLLVIYLVYYGTQRGYKPMPRYILPATIFAQLYVAMFLGKLFETSIWNKKAAHLLVLLFIPILVILGIWIGTTWSPMRIFTPKMLNNYPRLVGTFYGCGSLLIVLSLAALQWTQKSSRLIIFALFPFLLTWTAAFPGGITATVMRWEKRSIGKYYSRAHIPLLAPNRNLDIYLTEWEGDKRVYRAVWAYHFFFDPLYRNNDYFDIPEEKKKRVRFLNSLQGLKNDPAKFVLTDTPKEVRQLFDDRLTFVRTGRWNGKKLYLLKHLNKPKKSTK